MVGLVAVLVNTPSAELLMPGPLAGHHDWIADCEDCHATSYHEGPARWVLAALEGPETRDDSQRCLACHEPANDNDPLAPHTLPPLMLPVSIAANDRQPFEQGLIDTLFTLPQDAAADGFACATCHAEHRGVQPGRIRMANGRCQSCHAMTFSAFADGHPPFSGFPYQGRKRIAFDHRSHATRYFAEHDPPRENTRCVDCHVSDATGREMLVRGYEETCAECHDGDIGGAADVGPRGVAFMRAPGIDLVELEERGVDVGHWPEDADEPLTPFMRILFAADPETAEALALVENVDMLDLRDAGEEDVAAVERLAWAVKGLVRDLAVEGAPGLAERMAASLGVSIDDRQLRGLVGLLPPDVANAIGETWFPDLHRELARRARGEPIAQARDGVPDEPEAETSTAATTNAGDLLAGGTGAGGDLQAEPSRPGSANPDEPPPADHERLARFGGWYRDYMTLYYRPAGHADPLLKSYMDITGKAAADSEARGLFDELTAEDSPGRCGKCHIVDRWADGSMVVQWPSRKPGRERRRSSPPTNFSHETHIGSHKESGCVACHVLAEKDGTETSGPSPSGRHTTAFTANFGDLPISICADCHTQESARDDCTLCHQYHFGRFATDALPTRMADML